jgi:WD40 repeat protein/transcriptional regulator with XRE-family HTH domain
MGRPERPVDPEAGPVHRFAHELRLLRREAGSPSYRTMAQRARFSVTALSRAASGERLPSAAVVRAYAQACGADPDAWELRWKAVAEEAVACEGREGESPYQGLARFEPGDRELFFGRDRLVGDVLRLVQEHRFAVLLGASGSGKSSLLRAGLMPRLEALARETGRAAELRLITPGARPSRTHGSLLAPRGGGVERVVVVDQFEEIFTLCRDRADRWRFVDQLLAAKDPAAGLRVVVAVGGTFYGRCTEHPELVEALRHTSLTVGAMSREELREAVVRPAVAAGLRVERELTARIVEEAADRPGALPMLSHVLRETWRRRRGGVLTLAGYEATGGVHGAIAAAAEEVYGRLSPAQAGTARRLLLALITPGDGTPDTRRPVRRDELREWPDPEVPLVLERLAGARLVTLDEENVELAHEALITGWPRLQRWIEENRERLRQHRHLSEAARLWQEHGRDPGILYRGARLAVADVLFARDRHDDDLTATERAFLSASRVDHSMERWTAARMRRLTRGLVLALAAVVAGAVTVGQVAWERDGTADREHTRAAARQAAALAGRAVTSDPRTGTLLSVAAWRLAPLPESRAALLDALADPERDVFTAPVHGDGTRVFLTGSGRTLFGAGGGRWTTWDVATHRRTGSGRMPDVPVTAVGSDGRTLALAGDRRLWRLPSGDRGSAGYLPAAGPVLGFGTGGRSYLTGDAGPRERAQLRTVVSGEVLFEGAAYPVPSADDRLVAVCAGDGRPLTLWDTDGRRTLPGAWETTATTNCSSETLAFSPAGTRFAAVRDTGIRVWDTISGRRLADIAAPADARQLTFTPDGEFLAATTQGGLTVWRLSAPEVPVFRRPLTDGPATALAWDTDTPTLRYLAASTVHTLDLSAPLTSRWLARSPALQTLSPDGRLLATAECSGDGCLFRLRDTGTDRVVAELPAPAGAVDTGRPLLAFSPDSRALAYGIAARAPGTSAAPVVVWDVRAHRERASLDLGGPPGSTVRSIALTPSGRELLVSRVTPAGVLTGQVWDTARRTRTAEPDALAAALRATLTSGFSGAPDTLPYGSAAEVPLAADDRPDVLALSADGTHLATGGAYGNVTVWEGAPARHRAAVVPALPAAPGCADCARVTALAFSPDGRTLAVGYGSGALRLWDTTTRQPLGGSLNTPGDPIRSLAFGADGSSVHASGGHVPVQTYAIGPSQVVTQLCARAGTTLSRAEWQTYLPDVPYRRLCDPAGADPDAGSSRPPFEAGSGPDPAPSSVPAPSTDGEPGPLAASPPKKADPAPAAKRTDRSPEREKKDHSEFDRAARRAADKTDGPASSADGRRVDSTPAAGKKPERPASVVGKKPDRSPSDAGDQAHRPAHEKSGQRTSHGVPDRVGRQETSRTGDPA